MIIRSIRQKLLSMIQQAPHQRTILVCMNPEKDYQITLNGKTVKSKIYHEGLLEITLPNTNKGGRLTIVSI